MSPRGHVIVFADQCPVFWSSLVEIESKLTTGHNFEVLPRSLPWGSYYGKSCPPDQRSMISGQLFACGSSFDLVGPFAEKLDCLDWFVWTLTLPKSALGCRYFRLGRALHPLSMNQVEAPGSIYLSGKGCATKTSSVVSTSCNDEITTFDQSLYMLPYKVAYAP